MFAKPHIFHATLKGLIRNRMFGIDLRHNFHALPHWKKIVYWVFLRPFQTKEEKFFFVGSLLLPGQMYSAERKALFDAIQREKPVDCFEIGTFTGGGSTYFLAESFYKLGKGKLVTMESDERLYNKAKNYYAEHLPHLVPFVEFVHGNCFADIKAHIQGGAVSSFFLDGAENAQETLDQYNEFMPFVRTGTILMAHDWNTDKTRAVKPVILADVKWQKQVELGAPESVGFVVFKRI